MTIGTQDRGDEVMGEINMIPFIDVMLVLLIIFIITVPVVKHAVHVELPRASVEKVHDRPEHIRLSVDADGVYFWNGQRVDDADFVSRLNAAASQQPQPELQVHADRAVRYERVALALAAAHRAGVRRIGFITEPEPGSP